MPTEILTKAELDDSMALLECGMELDSGSSSDESIADLLIDEACKPFARQRLQEIGPERLSLERLQREARERGFEPDDLSTSIWSKYMFRLADLPAVVEALDPPPGFRTPSGLFSGEEGVLLLLRRFRTTDALAALTWETGRGASAISEAVSYMIEYIEARFPWLLDERSFSSWAPHFERFARCHREKGIPIDNLIGWVDGKGWDICKPGMYQRVMYSGHSRCHQCKTQGIVFPNGVQPYPFGPCHGSTHDSTILRDSRILQIMHDSCRGGQYESEFAPGGLGRDYVLFGDSAYPVSYFLYRMYKGVMMAWQRWYNSEMSPARVTVEWGFGKIVALWPYLDYRKKQKVLLSNVGLNLKIGNVLTNMHTCLYGSIMCWTDRPELHEYMRGGPYSM